LIYFQFDLNIGVGSWL